MTTQYIFNPDPFYLDGVIGLALGSDGPSIHRVSNPKESDESLQLAVNKTCDWLIETYGVDQLVERKILIAE